MDESKFHTDLKDSEGDVVPFEDVQKFKEKFQEEIKRGAKLPKDAQISRIGNIIKLKEGNSDELIKIFITMGFLY